MWGGVFSWSNTTPQQTTSGLCLEGHGWWPLHILTIGLGGQSRLITQCLKVLEKILLVSAWRSTFRNLCSQNID
ncbi:hypothetical protein LINPERHAP2_LOCUS16789 [Linum perenne]